MASISSALFMGGSFCVLRRADYSQALFGGLVNIQHGPDFQPLLSHGFLGFKPSDRGLIDGIDRG
jgi:hypothetical protein